MEGNRREFLKTIVGTAAATVLGESEASAQKNPEKGATFNPSSEFQKILQKYSSVDGGKIDTEVLKEDAEKHRGYAKEDPGTARIEKNIVEILELKYKILKNAEAEIKFWENHIKKPVESLSAEDIRLSGDTRNQLLFFKRKSDSSKMSLNIDPKDPEWEIANRYIGDFYKDMLSFITKIREYYKIKGAKVSFYEIEEPSF